MFLKILIIDRFMAFFWVFLFFSGYFLFSDHTFWPKKLLFWNILWSFYFFYHISLRGGGCGGWHMTICPRSGLLQLDVVLVFLLLLSSSLTHFSVLLHLLHFYNRVILKIIYFLIFRRKKTHFLKENMDFFIFRVISLVLKIP